MVLNIEFLWPYNCPVIYLYSDIKKPPELIRRLYYLFYSAKNY